MKRYIHVTLKAVLSLILLMPILGTLGVFPRPTRDLYNTDIAFTFIDLLVKTGYINYMISIVHVVALFTLWTRREALAALIVTPIVANIIGFHAFLDSGLFTGGALLANIFLILIVYFLYRNRETYKVLWKRNK